MIRKQKIWIAFISIILGCFTIVVYENKSIANPGFISNFPNQLPSKQKSHNQNFHQMPKLVLANVEISNKQLIYCWIQQRSPLTNSVELFMRLISIGSLGSVSIAGSSSLVQRYLHIIQRDYVVIVRCVILLLGILIISNVVIFLVTSTHPSFSNSCPKPNFFFVHQSDRFDTSPLLLL